MIHRLYQIWISARTGPRRRGAPAGGCAPPPDPRLREGRRRPAARLPDESVRLPLPLAWRGGAGRSVLRRTANFSPAFNWSSEEHRAALYSTADCWIAVKCTLLPATGCTQALTYSLKRCACETNSVSRFGRQRGVAESSLKVVEVMCCEILKLHFLLLLFGPFPLISAVDGHKT